MFNKFNSFFGSFHKSNQKSRARRSRESRRLQIESLEQRQLMTAAPSAPAVTATVDSNSQISITWAPVAGATGYTVEAAYAGGSWTKGNYTSSTTLVNFSTLSANTTYEFYVGATNAAGTTFSKLVTAVTAEPVTHPTAEAGTTYQVVNGSLFGANGPQYTDVHQGLTGDCWLLASLAEVASRDPQDIRNMFTSDGTATENGVTVSLYTVHFYNSSTGAIDSVVVDNEFPAETVNGMQYLPNAQAEGGVLWVALAEKAYAQANGAGYVASSDKGVYTYAALDGGYGSYALPALTGQSAGYYAGSNFANSVGSLYNGGYMVVLGSASYANNNNGIVGDADGTHAYAVIGYTASTNTFELYNPWGQSTVNGQPTEESIVNSTVTYKDTLNGVTTYHTVYGGAFYASASTINTDFANESYVAAPANVGPADGSQQPAAAPAGAPSSSSNVALAMATFSAPNTGATSGSPAAQSQPSPPSADSMTFDDFTADLPPAAIAIDQMFAQWNGSELRSYPTLALAG